MGIIVCPLFFKIVITSWTALLDAKLLYQYQNWKGKSQMSHNTLFLN